MTWKMGAVEQENLIDGYKWRVIELFRERSIRKLSDAKEAALAQERADIWDEIPEHRHAEIETWIEEQKRGTHGVDSWVSTAR